MRRAGRDLKAEVQRAPRPSASRRRPRSSRAPNGELHADADALAQADAGDRGRRLRRVGRLGDGHRRGEGCLDAGRRHPVRRRADGGIGQRVLGRHGRPAARRREAHGPVALAGRPDRRSRGHRRRAGGDEPGRVRRAVLDVHGAGRLVPRIGASASTTLRPGHRRAVPRRRGRAPRRRGPDRRQRSRRCSPSSPAA